MTGRPWAIQRVIREALSLDFDPACDSRWPETRSFLVISGQNCPSFQQTRTSFTTITILTRQRLRSQFVKELTFFSPPGRPFCFRISVFPWWKLRLPISNRVHSNPNYVSFSPVVDSWFSDPPMFRCPDVPIPVAFCLRRSARPHPPIALLLQTKTKPQFDRAVTARSNGFFRSVSPPNHVQSIVPNPSISMAPTNNLNSHKPMKLNSLL
jgi:hypothetical protein